MARPRTAVGDHGDIHTVAQIQTSEGRWRAAPDGAKPSRWRARTKYRDQDGALRDVERFGATKAKAVTALKRALQDRQHTTSNSTLTATMTVEKAATVWLEQVDRADSKLSDNTRTQYRGAVERYVNGSTIGSLTLREANSVQTLERWLQGVADNHGTGSAKIAKSVVSSILGLAVRYGVLPHNAMKDVRPAKASEPKATKRPRDTRRAFTREEREHVLDVATRNQRAQEHDVVDLLHFLAGTGVRISEALAVQWADVDLDAGTVRVRGTKSAHADRLLTMPAWLTERLAQRADDRGATGLLFPTPGPRARKVDPDQPRDSVNVLHIVREVLDEAGAEWATSHTFRRTVATLIDEAGLPVALAANQLGHSNPAMTASVYLGRRGSTAAAAEVL